jgi:ABC-type multidrug transport system fused ATPase/permease subunit
VSEERISAFLAREPMDQRESGGGIAREAGRVALRDLGVEGLFNGLSAEVPAGARVALCGPTGAGKSRLLSIIAGLENPDHGKVVIDGRDTGVRRLAALRRLVAMVGADVPLLRGTVAGNIRCGARAKEADAKEILAITGWERFAAALPDGPRTRVHSGGRGLSAGQRTRVSLIRALMRKPVLLLLDDIDGTLDEESELILAAIFVRFEGTIIMVTQDPRWQARCDTVWRLEDRELRSDSDQTSDSDQRRTARV